MQKLNHIGFSLGLLLLLSCSGPRNEVSDAEIPVETTFSLPEKVNYNFHIKPILSDRCFACHGPDANKREAELALHNPEGLFSASTNNPTMKIVAPGSPGSSLLYLRIASSSKDSIMPPLASNLSLESEEVALIKKWIEQGAVWEKHWAFIPPENAAVPQSAHPGKDLQPIDHFIFEKAKEKGLQPTQLAGSEQLLRRLSLDVRGLPPQLEEVQKFAADPGMEGYVAKVDAYLASLDHAEMMAAFWLDIARYADTNGYQDDLERSMWPWRDWVVKAFYTNLPYDDFVTWQLAGDLLPNATTEMRLATGFNRNHKITQEGGALDDEYRTEYVADRAGTSFTAFQALTLECARCHDHKFDPISQKEFFQVFDFFNHVPEKGVVDYGMVVEPNLKVDDKTIKEILDFIEVPDSALPAYPLVMSEEPGLRSTHILDRGQYDAPLEKVSCGTPSAVLEFDNSFTQNRVGFAEWLFDPQNPLTARVIVNRLWQLYFGRGIVLSSADFGNQGALPSHPELLDWLALELIGNDWDLRHIERMILLSYTYRQDSRSESRDRDPENIFLARSSRFRLSAEKIRDQALALSGLLVNRPGGPPVKPYQPAGLWKEKTSGGGYIEYKQDEGAALYRKSLYTFWKRTVPPPSLQVFDAPTRDNCTVNRQRTNTPLQALVLLNDPQQMEAARFLAADILNGQVNDSELVTRAFERVVMRKPEPSESKVLDELFQSEKARFREDPEAAKKLLRVGASPTASQADPIQLAALTMVSSTLLNLDETVCRP